MPSSDRPPTILSPYGEGYCRYCQFVIGLGPDGRMDSHWRGRSMTNSAECKGSGKTPPKLTPRASHKAAFKVAAPMCTCHVCNRRVALLSDGRMDGHTMAVHLANGCAGSYTFPQGPQRDHSGERG